VITIAIDVEEALHSVNRMVQSIEHMKSVDLGHELSEWQVQDVHRNRPFTMRYRRAGRAQTVFRPHSWKQMKRSGRYQRRGQRAIVRLAAKPSLKAARAVGRFQAQTSVLPILREELVTKLGERLIEMAKEQLQW
jgi:hypothetical protein